MHIPVLLHESIENLDIKPGDIFVDATVGTGGHSEEVAKLFGSAVAMICIDQDPGALDRSRKRLQPLNPNVRYVLGNFGDLDKILDELKINKINKIIFDLGWSTDLFETSGKGFSFQKDEPLVMTFGEKPGPNGLTAMEIVNSWQAENIETILSAYGEEQFAGRIARAIVKTRVLKPIETTLELVEIILGATPKFYHHRKIHPATKTFQALRIAVNDEIGVLKNGLKKSFERLEKKGRMAVISFHSLEDRQVKLFFKEKVKLKECLLINKKPIVPTREEILKNPRARSAKLRILEKTSS